jgi:phosphoribosylaminoimidazole-succinocarboxamide synthase
MEPLLRTDFPDLKLFKRGKVRDVYDLGAHYLIVSTDRISAFDCVMPNGIPHKGQILTGLAAFWFELMQDVVPNHVVSCDAGAFPRETQKYREILAGRSMLVKKAELIEIECIVRGYLAGSGWKDYQKSGMVCGHQLPAGMPQAAQLPEPIFTPSTKAAAGHDINISEAEMVKIIGPEAGEFLKKTSLAIYRRACRHAETRGIIIADTKFEFGRLGDKIILIDEILTPDSSRFWPQAGYRVGESPQSFDKQFVRDYLETLAWDKTPPAPALPAEVVAKTEAKYLEAYERITGRKLASA